MSARVAKGSPRTPITVVLWALPILLVFGLVPSGLVAHAPRIQTELDTTLVSVGDRMQFIVRVEHDPGTTVVWPDSLSLGSVEVLGAELLAPVSQGGRSVTSARFALASFELGDLEIPSFDVRVEAPDGSSATLSTDSYLIWDVAGKYWVNDKLNLFLRVDNLLDEDYLVARRPAGLRPGRDRQVMLGVQLEF